MSQSGSASPTWRSRDVILGTLIVVGVSLAFYLAYRARYAIVVAATAIILATALQPLVRWLSRPLRSVTVASVVVHLSVLSAVAALLVLTLPVLASQLMSIFAQLPEQYEAIETRLLESKLRAARIVGYELPDDLWAFLERRSSDPSMGDLAALVGSAVPAYTVVFVLLVIFLLSFYWCIEGERALRYLLLLMPAPRRPAVAEILGEVQTRLGQFVRGQLVLCVLVGFISWGAYWLIGLPYAGLLALIAGVLEAVPLIGPIVATVPATAVGLSLGWQHALWAVVANILIAHFESYILLPRIMNRSLGLHPVVTLVGIVVLVTLVGPVGGVLAIPSAAIAQLLFNRFVFRPPSLQVSLDENHRGPEADLLYEAQELKRDIRTHFGAWAASSGIAEARAVEERAEGWVDDFAAYVARPTVVEGTP